MKLILTLFLLTNLYSLDLLLLKTYKDQNISGWLMSEKLDGVRAYWDGKHLLSRNGKIIHAPSWFTKDYPPFAIDGELWTKRGDFENITSIVRDQTPSDRWHSITHNIFEVPYAKGGLLMRLERVKPYLNDHIKLIPQIKIKSKQHLKDYLHSLESKGAEGIVVHDPDVSYIAKRTSKALKVKSFHDMECVVVGYTKGKGKYRDRIGALVCRLENGVEFKIGSGLSDEMRINPPKIGDVVTFKYQNITKYGKPRFPVYMRIRHE
jgi:DNA ligase-1